MSASVVAVHIWPAGIDTPTPVAELELDWGGPVGDRHHGLTMASDVRQKDVFPRGTTIRNHRQISIVDVAELESISAELGIAEIAPGVVADNICTEGINGLTELPRMTRLLFAGGAVVMLGGENFPCTIAGALVGARYGTAAERFPKSAMGRRGVTGWVEHPGLIHAGASIEVRLP
ncbi:MAG: MOSC domain-containing protein [Actinomycetota bacterium]|nr:MOSC domain-containing protein [Actinomycetota bacterium]